MKLQKLAAAALAALMAAAALAGCQGKEQTPAEAQEIKLGVLAPLTGTFAEHGKSFQTAFEMTVDEINAAGGINGRTVKLDISDTEGDQKKAADLVTTYAEDQSYIGVLGGFSSGCAMAAAPICDDAGIPFVSPTASNIAFTQASKYCFSMPGISIDESQLMAVSCCYEYCKAKSVYLFALNSDWGISAVEGFKLGAEKVGLEILGEESYVAGETDFSAMITKASAADPDLIVILDQTPGILINQIRTAGITTPIADYGASTSAEIITLCGENAEGLVTIGLSMDTESERGKAFVEEFVSRAGYDPSMWAAYAYEAAHVMMDAIKACGDDLTRENLREAIANTDGDYLLGRITFNADGNRVIDLENSPYKVAVVQNGAWVEMD